jgi:Fur family transcriptional regulator, ferric uptake regulator
LHWKAQLNSSIDEVREFIRQKGYRLTPQRQVVYDFVRQGGGHLSVEQVFQGVRKVLPRVNLATIYRTLNFLCELRLVVAADIGGGNWVYELAGDQPHHHLVCRTCGAVLRIEHSEVAGMIDDIAAQHAFWIDMDHMALFGQCAICRQSGRA